MKRSLLPFAAIVVIAFSSCSSAYKSGQTPDDVYYSPVRAQDEYVRTERKDDRMYQGSDQYYEDRYLRMRVANPYRWSPLDDYYLNYGYGYNSFRYSDPWAWNSPWNNYYSWNHFYNPYYTGFNNCYYGGGWGGWGGYGPGVIIVNPKNPVRQPVSRPVAFNPNSYLPNSGNGSRSYNNGNRLSNSYSGSRYQGYNNSNSSGRYNSSNNNYNSGSYQRNSNSNNSYNNNNSSTPSRSYSPSSSGSSSGGSSGGSGGGGGVSRPGRN